MNRISNWTFAVSSFMGGAVLALVCVFTAPDVSAVELFAATVLIGAAVSCAVLWKVVLVRFRDGVGAAALSGILAAAIYFLVTATVLVIRDSVQVLVSTRNSMLMIKFSFYLTICSSVGGLITAIVLRLFRSKKVT